MQLLWSNILISASNSELDTAFSDHLNSDKVIFGENNNQIKLCGVYADVCLWGAYTSVTRFASCFQCSLGFSVPNAAYYEHSHLFSYTVLLVSVAISGSTVSGRVQCRTGRLWVNRRLTFLSREEQSNARVLDTDTIMTKGGRQRSQLHEDINWHVNWDIKVISYLQLM